MWTCSQISSDCAARLTTTRFSIPPLSSYSFYHEQTTSTFNSSSISNLPSDKVKRVTLTLSCNLPKKKRWMLRFNWKRMRSKRSIKENWRRDMKLRLMKSFLLSLELYLARKSLFQAISRGVSCYFSHSQINGNILTLCSLSSYIQPRRSLCRQSQLWRYGRPPLLPRQSTPLYQPQSLICTLQRHPRSAVRASLRCTHDIRSNL